ncbi:Helix-turn-helix domain-containing protein [Rugamonas rubra]|uniref:Helix-turn-helix domain-containing protein n=2 Tax=Rugamonas rubra TaxID=758825 RepID=A0A1I4PST8_9BURK|nr:Helix-turn-helix domain-containing protein [Rugamonas rubra]
MAAMLYQEYAPHPALARHVDCLWTCRVHGRAQAVSHRVLPDNCVDILWQNQHPDGFAVGMMSGAIEVVSSGLVQTVAVRFKPGAAGRFLALPLHALTDQRAGMDELWGRGEAARLADALWTDELAERARLALLEAQLLERLRRGADAARANSSEALVAAALAAIAGDGGAGRIAGLAERLGVSRQHLATLFRTRVGLAPKLYARICRFRRATEALRGGAAPDWAQLALDCGYFDQSHLIHDFQEFAGRAPERFLAAD